ncbi:transcriptional regulator [Plantibacter flavus]|uniref:winged helix-turn-helix transcriptional regulator n=1 Tax=Plantibacter TaxID=190323 RepID=UPI0010C166D1|nr:MULTISPECIES: helix-turn-helix domain-containing protein [Plantibacter]MBD8103906.1 helix-turn-helix transcriptional regulator [Plantibacter sp. CFBP 8775]MBD8467354.1 helix-turn-helix transcriptional regulator [Plantibacter sp. CFBP 8798]TKJ96820.1 transcriptional regulator [Plantibacter flavus]
MSFSAEAWPECGIARFLTLLDGPWATLIVRELLGGPLRFGDLKAALPGISAHTLTNRLRRFETYGIVTRTAYGELPPRVEYELTGVGHGLQSVLDAMNAWAATVPTPVDDAVPLPASCVGEGRASEVGSAVASRQYSAVGVQANVTQVAHTPDMT